jgi:hypothetical protein
MMTSSRSRARGIGGLVCAGAFLVALPAFANGGDFFEEFATSWAITDPNAGPAFFGFIRDARGKAIPNAAVSASIRPGGAGVVVQSDILGHYRIPGFAKTIDPGTIVVGCAKPGYRQVASNRYVQKDKPNAPIEILCRLAPVMAANAS